MSGTSIRNERATLAGGAANGLASRLLIRDLVLGCDIGAYAHEYGRRQRVRINLSLALSAGGRAAVDGLAGAACYESIVRAIRGLIERDHVNLVETLAERIAVIALADRRIRSALVRVEKLDVFEDVASVGVEIERMSRLC
ncbi:MAG: dihydroneopterin aldolase [Rhodospirillales bacterium]|nr:dihydroneopterin aldolase [Rhodospirillales bacterium]